MPPETIDAEVRRIQRQALIPDWKQATLDKSLLMNIGDGSAARYAALLASCIEFGSMALIGDGFTQGKEGFLGQRLKRGYTVERLADIISQLNPNIDVEALRTDIKANIASEQLRWSANAFLYSGNDFEGKRFMLANFPEKTKRSYTDEEKIEKHYVLTAGNDHELRVGHYFSGRIPAKLLMPQPGFQNTTPTAMIGLAQASLSLAELVTSIMGLGKPLDDIVTLNYHSAKRTSWQDDYEWKTFDPKGFTIGIVGDGAIGTMYKEALHDIGFGRVHTWDFDTIEITNWARAPHFIGKTGEYKSAANAQHFNARKGTTRYTFSTERFTEDTSTDDIDLLICAVDGYENQMIVINNSQRNQVPLLLGGCTPFSTVVHQYVPGKTSSMLYQYDFLREAYLSTIRQEHRHCTDPDVEGSNMLTTALAASLLALETINHFSGGEPLQAQLRYDMLDNPRLSYTPIVSVRDLGTDIPVFTPLPKQDVKREVVADIETISVQGKPFHEWYDKVGNIRNFIQD